MLLESAGQWNLLHVHILMLQRWTCTRSEHRPHGQALHIEAIPASQAVIEANMVLPLTPAHGWVAAVVAGSWIV